LNLERFSRFESFAKMEKSLKIFQSF